MFILEVDCVRIFRIVPWFFDKSLIVFEKPNSMVKLSELEFKKVSFWVHFVDLPMVCMNKAMAICLGNAIGSFEGVECDEDNCCWEGVYEFVFPLIFRNP